MSTVSALLAVGVDNGGILGIRYIALHAHVVGRVHQQGLRAQCLHTQAQTQTISSR